MYCTKDNWILISTITPGKNFKIKRIWLLQKDIQIIQTLHFYTFIMKNHINFNKLQIEIMLDNLLYSEPKIK